MEWTQGQIQKLIESTDYSAETDLKERLFSEITSIRKISLDELGERIGRNKGSETRERHGRERQAPEMEAKLGSVMNNDEPLLPGGM